MKDKEYQICSNCVMDTTDPDITFDEKGRCDFCTSYENDILPNWQPNKDNTKELLKIADKIKAKRKGKKYDCIIGLSGGVDSSYLTYIAKEIMGLNPLIYCVDTGWNLAVATENIEKIVKKLNLDMYTEVVDWNAMRDLQLSFFKAQVPYQDTPQDHVIFAGLYNYAIKNNIKYILTGFNYSTECVKPPYEWTYINDMKFIKDVHKRYGQESIKTLPLCGMIKNRVYYRFIKGMKVIHPLNYISFDKKEIQKKLENEFGWQSYKNKHYENVFTRFFEGYYLPYKFGYDKRKCYLSSLILTNQISRQDALLELNDQPYDKNMVDEDIKYIAKKLEITVEEFENIINGPNKTFRDYKNSFSGLKTCINIAQKMGIEKRNFR